MRIAVLVPAPDYPEPWAWAYDVEAAALASSGAEVEPIAWTEADDLTAFDLVLPLVFEELHSRCGGGDIQTFHPRTLGPRLGEQPAGDR